MVNTYSENAEPMIKIAEELRLIRCILERQLAGTGFVDYQMEKFGSSYKSIELSKTPDKKEELSG